tara:strand:- start:6301 stop:6552 length:252 start_codon:yes stop_codon:yes gene_type:complete
MSCPPCPQWDDAVTVKDAHGTLLAEGNKVTMIKDLKVKGSSLVLKVGTKALIKRRVDSKDHQLECKVDGVGDMKVTAHFVKKV